MRKSLSASTLAIISTGVVAIPLVVIPAAPEGNTATEKARKEMDRTYKRIVSGK